MLDAATRTTNAPSDGSIGHSALLPVPWKLAMRSQAHVPRSTAALSTRYSTPISVGNTTLADAPDPTQVILGGTMYSAVPVRFFDTNSAHRSTRKM